MKKRIVLTLIMIWFCMAVITGQGFFGFHGNRRGNEGDGTEIIGKAVVQIKYRYITVGGRLNPARRLDHSIPVSGYVDKIFFDVGKRVSSGDSLILIARESTGESYKPYVIESRISGRISKIHVEEKAEVKAGAIAVTIIDDTNFIMEATISDKDAFYLAQFINTDITGISPAVISLKGRLLNISAEPDYTTGLFTLTFKFPAQENARIGMVLFIDLPVKKVQGIFVFKDLIERRLGRNLLWVIDDNDVIGLKSVEIGDVFDTEVLIVKGLSKGEQYLQRLTGNEKDGMTLEELFPETGETRD